MKILTLGAHIASARRAGLLRLRKAHGPVRLECLRDACSLCCQALGGTHVEPTEEPALRRFNILEKRNGDVRLKCAGAQCLALENGICSVYDFRPQGCREYPWYNIGGVLHFDNGCPGMRFDRDERPNVRMLRRIDEYLPVPRVAREILIWLFRRW